MFSEIAPDGLIGNLEQQLQDLQEESKGKLDESKQREQDVKDNDAKIANRQSDIEQTGTLFVRAKEALDVILDFEEMLEAGLASEIADLVDEKVRLQERYHELKKLIGTDQQAVIEKNNIES